MTAIDLYIAIGPRFRDGIDQYARHLLGEFLPRAEVGCRMSRVFRSPAILAMIYVTVPWEGFFAALRIVKGHLEESGTSVEQFIVLPHRVAERDTTELGSEFPSARDLMSTRGAWVQAHAFAEQGGEELRDYLKTQHLIGNVTGWSCLPFDPDAPDDDSMGDYDGCEPTEIPLHFATRVSGSSVFAGAPVGLRIRMVAGSTIADYVDHSYRSAFASTHESSLGGANVVLTTLLQMNDKLELVNTYCESLPDDLPIKLLSLPAMRMRVTDERDETDIANLIARGDIVISNLILGI
jgi:hypothetical protein